MNMRPLYLEAGIAWRVALDAGVALHVSAPGRARSLYPLQRLARVVCGSHSAWDTDALLACLQAGVPVVFHDRHGDAVGWCFGPRRRETTLGQLLREGLQQPQWPQRFTQWHEAACRREVLAALRTMEAHSCRLDPAAVRSRLCNVHRLRMGKAAGPWLRALHRAANGLTAEAVQHAVADPALIGFARPGLHLGLELTTLLEWQLHCMLYATPLNTLLIQTPGRFAAGAVEREGAMLHRTCGDLLGDLEYQLREWLL